MAAEPDPLDELRRAARERPELWRGIAIAERRRDDPAAAARAMQRYLQEAPDDASAWASLGDFLDDAGRPEEAEAAWQRALELDPGDPTLHYNWGVSAGRRGDLERVRVCAEALASRDPKDPLALAIASILLEAEGDVAGGWTAMQRAVEREGDPDRAVALAHRALRYAERNGLGVDARALIDGLHQRNLFDEDVHEAINRLENVRSEQAHDFAVVVDAVPPAAWCPPGTDRRAVRGARVLRVVAEGAAQARALAAAFERRCGAQDVVVQEVEDLGALEEPDHLGVWHSQETPDFRAAEGEG